MNLHKFIEHLSSNFNLKYQVYDKARTYSLPYSVRLEIIFAKEKISSWGVSHDEEAAYFKALMELIERVCLRINCSYLYKKSNFFSRPISLKQIENHFNVSTFLLHPQNSNGTGLNTSKINAKKSAKLELIERHVLLSAILLNVPPNKYKYNSKFHMPHQCKASFFYWKLEEYYIALSVIELPDQGLIFGSACSEDIEKAFEKALFETVPSVIWYLQIPKTEASKAEIIPGHIPSFHKYWRTNPDKKIFDFLNRYDDCDFKEEIPKLNTIFYSDNLIPKQFKNYGFELFCFRAISPDAQQLFFDNWEDKYINKRIFKHYQFPSYPHFIA